MNDKTAKELLEKVKADYEFISEEFNVSRQCEWKEFDLYLKYIKNGDNLADLGCGNGRFINYIKSKKKVKYIGIDNSKSLLSYGKQQHPKTNFIEGDLLNLPIENNSIDTVVSIASLHHIPTKKLREKAIEEIKRIMKPDGILILSVWNLFQKKYKKYIWQARINRIISLLKYDSRDTFIPWGKKGVKRYYYAFTEIELEKLLKNHFKILEKTKGNNIIFICRINDKST